MSPSEEQLRRALSEGQGAGPDVDTVLVRAAAYRRARRTKILATAAVVAVVAGIGTGVGVLASRPAGSHSTASEKAADRNSGNAAGSAGGVYGLPTTVAASVPSPPVANASGLAATRCPATAPAYSRADTSTSASFFSHPLTRVIVCGYVGTGAVVLDPTSHQPLQHVYASADASAIGRAIAAAPRTNDYQACGAIPAVKLHRLLVVAQYASGELAPGVLIGLDCDTSLTNGQAVAFNWQQPHVLDTFVAELATAAEEQTNDTGGGAVPAPTTS